MGSWDEPAGNGRLTDRGANEQRQIISVLGLTEARREDRLANGPLLKSSWTSVSLIDAGTPEIWAFLLCILCTVQTIYQSQLIDEATAVQAMHVRLLSTKYRHEIID